MPVVLPEMKSKKKAFAKKRQKVLKFLHACVQDGVCLAQ